MADQRDRERAPYFVVQRLVGTADHHWTRFNGWAISQGVDLTALPLDALLDFIYYWITKDAEEEDVKRLDAELWLPPKGTAAPKESPWSDEATKASLAAFANMPGGAVI